MLRAPARSLVALSVASALLALGACGDDDPESAAPSVAPSTASSTTAPSPSASPSKAAPKVKPSTDLDAVKVSGDYGKAPKVSVKAPWAIDKTRTKVLEAGDGAEVKTGQTVDVNYYGVNGRTGKKFDDSFSRGQSVAFPLGQVVPGFQKGLVGQRQGSRVAVAMPGADGYDAAGGNPQIGVEVGDTLLFVVDIVGVQLTGPSGKAVTPKAGLPTVTVKDGKPQISVPKTDPPPALQVQPLIKGTGRKVAAGDNLTFNYQWVAWKDGRELETSYGSQPANLPVAGLIAGMKEGLTGQTVGSRVLLVIPPAKAYPEGNATPRVDKGETLVMVVDLLFASPAQ
ncbi:MAG: FKBP-type peptidyl-prolyl cis-trans isomerase [Actinomycetes bacterium]